MGTSPGRREISAMRSPPRATPGLPSIKVTCPCCGHKGSSQYPRFYRCSACYWEAIAKSNREKAGRLEAKATALREEAALNEDRAAAFRTKHGTSRSDR